MSNSDKDKQPLHQLTDDELKKILEEHAKWLRTENQEKRFGKQANLLKLRQFLRPDLLGRVN
jgi:hypothetical protein